MQHSSLLPEEQPLHQQQMAGINTLGVDCL